MECEHCGTEFVKTQSHQRFCCKACQHANWKKLNPGKHKVYNKRSRLKKPLLCRECSTPISAETRKSGLVFCSETCRRQRKLRLDQEWCQKQRSEFAHFKLSFGCAICKYARYGGSLDFHHVDPSEKDTRVDNKNWKSQLEELSKCVLVCKNCHGELHYLMRNDIDAYEKIIENLTEHTDLVKQELCKVTLKLKT